jgi:D-alanine-D-alanine ligase
VSVLRVLHFVGSENSEFYCNLWRFYAQDCLESTANSALYEFHIAYISPVSEACSYWIANGGFPHL